MINENPLSYTTYHYYACSQFFIVLLPPALSFTLILITFSNFLKSLPSGLVVWGFPPKFYMHYPSPHLTHINIQKKAGSLLILNKIYVEFNPLNPELNPICYFLALLGAHHFLHVSRIRVKLLTFRRLMSYIYGAPILDVSR